MLVLTRKIGQKLMLGDNVVITIVDARGDSIKIGIDAPRDVSIFREEIYLEIKAANEKATQTPKVDSLKAVMNLIPPTPPNTVQSKETK